MAALEEFRGAIGRLSPSDFAEDGRPKMKPLRKQMGEQISSNERNRLWDEHLATPLDNGMVEIMLTEAPGNPFTLTVNHNDVLTMRIGEVRKLPSQHVMALSQVSGVNFRFT